MADRITTRDIAASAETRADAEARHDDFAENRGEREVRAAREEGAPLRSERPEPLFPSEEIQGYRTRWDAIQTGFVDEPRRAVEEADNLVADVMQRLARVFADERSGLEHQWSQGDQVSTEELRLALRHYRSFFERLLGM